MATPTQQARALATISRDLDLVVYRLERDLHDLEQANRERREIRRELERLRDQVGDMARDLGY
jgi:chromosome segregation ATPase